MFNPNIQSQSYFIINPNKANDTILENQLSSERLLSVLYSHEYDVKYITEVFSSNHTKGYLASSVTIDDNTLRSDVLSILEFMSIETAFVKYFNQKNVVLITRSGEEIPQSIKINENSETSKNFIIDGFCFYFESELRYHYPKNKSHLKNGMIVEFMNDKTWVSREIKDIESEYDRMYNLLIKYNKLRVPIY